jgi:hypothetical protein
MSWRRYHIEGRYPSMLILPLSQGSSHPDPWSDIDVLMVSPRFDNERRRDDVNLL